NDIYYLIISDGSKGTRKIKSSRSKISQMREKEQRKAAKVLGVKNVFFLKFKDGEVENTKPLRKELVKMIRKIKPDIVFGFDPANLTFDNIYRFHRDHRMAAEAVFDSVFPAARNTSYFPELLKKGYQPHRVREIWFFATDKPNKFVDIEKTLKDKIKALSHHNSQILDVKEFTKRITSWAKETGRKKGYQYAESFRVIKLETD
ncbi:MAG: PIG-L family deacetylase, partial [Patescibacteria group bacterium]|nr:PIG-L family deacetylase [Patescibacteria group bacterium]